MVNPAGKCRKSCSCESRYESIESLICLCAHLFNSSLNWYFQNGWSPQNETTKPIPKDAMVCKDRWYPPITLSKPYLTWIPKGFAICIRASYVHIQMRTVPGKGQFPPIWVMNLKSSSRDGFSHQQPAANLLGTGIQEETSTQIRENQIWISATWC